MLGRETVDKVRRAVYVRAAARCLERELQADLRHRFGMASDSWLQQLWEYVEIEAGTVGLYAELMEPFFKAAYEANYAAIEEAATKWRAKLEAKRTAGPAK